MEISPVLRRLDHERRSLARDGEIIEVLAAITRLHAADHSHHSVIYSALTGDIADAVIEQEIDHHRRLNVAFEWKVYGHDGPPDLLDRLRGRGFDIGAKEAVLVYDLGEPERWAGAATDGVSVVRVGTSQQIADFRRVAEAVFAKDYTFTAGQLAAALAAGSDQHRGYVAYSGSTPVSIGRLYTHPDSWFGGLYGGGTLAAYRGRGFYAAVVAARARDAAASGARYLIVDALPTSRPILERVGFQQISETWPCEWRPAP